MNRAKRHRPDRQLRTSIPILILTAALVVLLSLSPAHRPLLIWNASPSVPTGLYRLDTIRPRRKDIVAVLLPLATGKLAAERRYLPLAALLLKPVVALAGDRVCRVGHHVSINGSWRAAAALTDAKGRPMPTWSGCHQLRVGALFVLGTRADSFDSRYFGSLPPDAIVGRATSIWTFKE